MIEKSSMQWEAWAPGVSCKSDWLLWSKDLKSFDPEIKPDVSFIKPMVRRRLSSLAKIVFATSRALFSDAQEALPLVFASRFGEMGKTVQLLSNLAKGEGLSPTSFGLSVHNSLVGMYGMINKWQTSSTAIAAGKSTLSAGLIEAISQSKAKESPIAFFYYDESLPEVYKQYDSEIGTSLCIGMIVDAENDCFMELAKYLQKPSDKLPIHCLNYLIQNHA